MLIEQFGPWNEHDGTGRPVPKGTVVEVEAKNITGLLKRHESVADGDAGSAWDWSSVGLAQPWRVIRYRVKKPRGLMILEGLLADLPEAVPA